MKRIILLAVAFAMAMVSEAQNHTKFNAGGVSDIHPAGWLQTLLQRQRNGLTGHPF